MFSVAISAQATLCSHSDLLTSRFAELLLAMSGSNGDCGGRPRRGRSCRRGKGGKGAGKSGVAYGESSSDDSSVREENRLAQEANHARWRREEASGARAVPMPPLPSLTELVSKRSALEQSIGFMRDAGCDRALIEQMVAEHVKLGDQIAMQATQAVTPLTPQNKQWPLPSHAETTFRGANFAPRLMQPVTAPASTKSKPKDVPEGAPPVAKSKPPSMNLVQPGGQRMAEPPPRELVRPKIAQPPRADGSWMGYSEIHCRSDAEQAMHRNRAEEGLSSDSGDPEPVGRGQILASFARKQARAEARARTSAASAASRMDVPDTPRELVRPKIAQPPKAKALSRDGYIAPFVGVPMPKARPMPEQKDYWSVEVIEVDYDPDDTAAPSAVSVPVPVASPVAADPEAGDFQGASGSAANAVLGKHHCSFCDKYYLHQSMVGHLYDAPPEFPWVKMLDTQMHKACVGTGALNFFLPHPIRTACAYCAQTIHKKKPYVISHLFEDGKVVDKVTSEWTRLKAKSRGMQMSKHHAELAAKLFDNRTGRATVENLPSTYSIYMSHKDRLMARACDWVVELGADDPFMWVLFGCEPCGIWTLGSHCWLRCQRLVRDLKEEATSTGVGEQQWRCGTCFGKWNWSLCGCMRLVVVGKASIEGGFEPGYQFSYIGQTDASVDNKLAFLRTASILRVLGGRPVTKASLLYALDVLQNEVVCKFSHGMREVRTVRSKVVTKEEQDYNGVYVTCEDPRLSLHAFNQEYLVLDKGLIEAGQEGRPIEVIDQEFLHYLLDFAAASYDIESMNPTGDGTKKLRWSVLESSGFVRGRMAIQSAM